jgi:dihydrofolate reductase
MSTLFKKPTREITVIAAMSENAVIGDNGKLPWSIPEELRFFKKTTMGGTLVMGRKTFESIGRPLPGRKTIVVTRSLDWESPGVIVANRLETALELSGNGNVFIAGGGEVYSQALLFANNLLISVIKGDFKGDTYFPSIDPTVWHKSYTISYQEFKVVSYRRNAPRSI